MCRSGCKTQDHSSYGACLRAAALHVGYCGVGGGDRTRQRKWDRELQEYRDARRQGIQPDSTNLPDIRRAVEASQKAGAAYGRDFARHTPVEA